MKKRFFVILLVIGFISVFPFKFSAAEETGEELKLFLGQVKTIPVKHPARIVIGNPEIIDVGNITLDQITINPKAAGVTTLVFWDNFGEQSFQVKVFAQDMQVIKQRVDQLLSQLGLPDIRTQAVDDEGKVLLLGSVKTSAERERTMTALGSLKDNIVDLLVIKELETVVEIDVQVLELDKDSTKTLGFTWPGAMTLTEVGSPGIAAAGTTWGKLFKVAGETRAAFTLKLDALIQEGKARVLSRPRLACQSGKEAELLVGGEKPIFTTTVAATTGAEGTEVEYKEFGIKLKIKPTVTEENRIKLSLGIEVSEVGTAETIGDPNAPTAKAYPLSKRSTATELFLDDGQTMAISGLIKERTEEDVRRTPFLSDLPLIGGIFRQRTTTTGGGTAARGNTELFVMLTPTIISTKPASEEKIKTTPETSVNQPPVLPAGPQERYALIVQKRIMDKLNYPLSAKQAGFQGTTTLSLHLSYSGELLDVAIKQSSGYKILDDHAVNIAKDIAQYPPFPPAIKKKDTRVDIPVEYRLD